MKCFKPNDVQCGDVLEHVFCALYKSVFLVVAVDRRERAIDMVLLIGSGLPTALSVGERYTRKYTSKAWKRFSRNFSYLSRGWDETLRLQQEHASGVEHDTMTK